MIAATTPTGRAISIRPRSRSSAITPTDFAPAQIAQQAHRLAPVLGDLVGDVAEAGVAHRALGERAIARRLDDRPAGGGDQLVDPLLRPAVERALRGARARDERDGSPTARSAPSIALIIIPA